MAMFEAVVLLAFVLTHSIRAILLLDSQQHQLVLREVAIVSQTFS